MKEKNKILIVDDQPKNLQLAATVLNPFYKLLIADSGQKAIKIALEKKPDLILLDIMMNEMSGFEVCEKLKNITATKNIPIIFLTAKTEEEDIVKAFEIGGVDYITKPFKRKEVLARIKTHLDLLNAKKFIEKQNDELIKVNNEKDKFFSIIAHDLKSPFTGFLSLTEMMAHEIEDFTPEELKNVVISLKDSANILYKLLENLLEWSLIKRGLSETFFERLQIGKLVMYNLEIIRAKAEQKKIILENDIKDELEVFADKNIINTVLRNLISNAAKFTNDGGKITVSAKVIESDIVEVSVKDTGMGISEKDIKRLFKIDEKVSNVGTAGESGTGLGLLLCKELIEKNNGTIKVESDIGKGTSFYFYLPVYKDNAVETGTHP
ncbi:MAG: hybrid sensor histidine kinase/response regulator [bacterium]